MPECVKYQAERPVPSVRFRIRTLVQKPDERKLVTVVAMIKQPIEVRLYR